MISPEISPHLSAWGFGSAFSQLLSPSRYKRLTVRGHLRWPVHRQITEMIRWHLHYDHAGQPFRLLCVCASPADSASGASRLTRASLQKWEKQASISLPYPQSVRGTAFHPPFAREQIILVSLAPSCLSSFIVTNHHFYTSLPIWQQEPFTRPARGAQGG